MGDPVELLVEYKRMNSFFSEYLQNICLGGTFIETAQPLPLGTEFVFRMTLPRTEEPLLLRGRVEGYGRGPGADGPAAGMRIGFVYAADGDRLALEGRVVGLMREHLGVHLANELLDLANG